MVLRSAFYDEPSYYNLQAKPKRRTMKPTHISLLAWHTLVLVYYCFTTLIATAQLTGASRLLDLSHTFDESTIYWVTAKKLNFTVTHNGTAPGKDYWYQSDEISAATHGGTHLDSPCHFALGRWCVSDIPIERLVVNAVVVDISLEVGDDPNVHLSPEHIASWEKVHGRIADGSLLLVRTGWSRFWPDPLTYSGTVERNVTLLRFPSIKAETAEWLVANRNIVGIGIDVMSIDIPGGVPQTHITLMEKNIYGLENVNLQQPLPPTGARVYVMPMKLKGASGAPCRIFAEVPEDQTSGSARQNAVSLVLTMVVILMLRTLLNERF